MVSDTLRFCFTALVLLVLVVLFGSQLNPHPVFVIPAVLGVGVIVGLLGTVISSVFSAFFLGALLMTLPIFGPGALNIFVAFWLIGHSFRTFFLEAQLTRRTTMNREIAMLGLMLFILALIGGGIHTYLLDFDSYIFSSVLELGGTQALYRYLGVNLTSWYQAALSIGAYIAACILFSQLTLGTDKDRGFFPLLMGLAFGSIIAAVLGFLQVVDVHPILELNRGPFWIFAGRFAGSLSDPNALGVMAAVLGPVLIYLGVSRRNIVFILGGILLLTIGLWSGSRTLWLGIFLWLLIFAFHFSKNAGDKRFSICLQILLILVPLVVSLGYPKLNRQLQSSIKIPGVVRVLKSVNWDDGAEMLRSRLIYGRAAIKLWEHHPLVGIGLDRFYHQQEKVMSLGDGWRDNANNFYLQVLSELGIFGLFLLLICIVFLIRATTGELAGMSGSTRPGQEVLFNRALLRSVSQMGLFALLVLLLTGPHLFFDEVRYLAAILLAIAVSQSELHSVREYLNWRRVFFAASFIFSIVFTAWLARGLQAPFIQGFYPLEESEDLPVAWSSAEARLALCNKKEQETRSIELSLRAMHPDIEERAVWVRLAQVDLERRTALKVFDTIELNNQEWMKVKLEFHQAPQPRILALAVDRTWSPLSAGVSQDARALGVMIQWPEEACDVKQF